MTIKTLISTILTLTTLTSISQTTWTFKDDNHSFIITVDTVSFGSSTGEYGQTVKTIDIYKLMDSKIIQTITPGQFIHESFLDSTTIFVIEDMNFDGYNDIRLLNWTSISLYTSYRYWFYDTASGQFKSDTTLERFMNPYFDQVKKTFHTYWRFGMNEFGHAIYLWTDKGLQLLAEQVETWGIEDGVSGTLVTKRLVGGQLKKQEIQVNEFNIHPHVKCDLFIE